MTDGGRGKLVLGTRGSRLALAQTEIVEEALRGSDPGLALERRIIRTTGDRRTDVPLAEVAKADGRVDKGVFIKELEMALEAGQIDVAVHSLKDVPSELADGFRIAAVLPRGPAGDVLVSRAQAAGEGWEDLPEGARVATGSVRRQRQLQWLRGDLAVEGIRGNVPTRLGKLAARPDLDALILAEAGLRRLGHEGAIHWEGVALRVHPLDPRGFVPAAGQGAVALEVRRGDRGVAGCIEAVNCPATMEAVTAEREFLRLLGAGCDTPVGVFGRIEGDRLRLRARVFEDGEEEPLEGEADGPRGGPQRLAGELLTKLQRAKP